MIFGDTTRFAIEINCVENKPGWGYSRVWITNKSIGDFSTPEILSPFVKPLIASRNIAPVWVDVAHFKNSKELYQFLTDYDLYQSGFGRFVKSDQSVTTAFDSHRAFSGENFDNYLAKKMLFAEHRYFLWGEYIDRNTSTALKELFLEKVPCWYYDAVISEVEDYIKTLS
jgi:hypothetical protein